jgi:hypothetical protein
MPGTGVPLFVSSFLKLRLPGTPFILWPPHQSAAFLCFHSLHPKENLIHDHEQQYTSPRFF